MSLFDVSGTGNLTADPELRYTPNGVPVVNFTVATNRNKKNDAGGWDTVASTFLRASAWRAQAESIANSFKKGDRIKVSGYLKQDDYEKDGQKRTYYEIEVQEVSSPIGGGGSTSTPPVQPNTGNSAPQSQSSMSAFEGDEPPF